MPTPSTALFDIGGVVIRTPFELYASAWRGPFEPATDPRWRALQAGDITEREYWHERASALHPDAADPVAAFMRPLYDVDEVRIVRPEIPPLLDDLQARGIRTAVLTNDLSAFHDDEWIARMTVLARFDPLIDLSHAGVLKPEPAAFAHALDVLGSRPDEIVFIDDQPGNVAGARDAGLRTVWFDPTDACGAVARVLASVDLGAERPRVR